MKKWTCFLAFILVSFCSLGQSGLVKRALKQLSDQDFSKVESTLLKIEEKDSLYSGLYYAKSKLYFDENYERFNIDSAHTFLLKGQQLLGIVEEKDNIKLAKAGASMTAFEKLKISIDSAAFERSKALNTEEAYLFFLKNYSSARHEHEAIELRNTKAFEAAVKINTYQAYRTFMDKYPKSVQYGEAKERYERLYFEKSTSDGRLASFQKFLNTHPSTPYRNELEFRIYQVITADHRPASYNRFRQQYPESNYVQSAERFGYHAGRENGISFRATYLKDSLEVFEKFPKELLFYGEAKKYGLMDLGGQAVSDSKFINIDASYLCDGIQGDVFLADGTIYSVTGAGVASEVKNFDELGTGLLAVQQAAGIRVTHKSGQFIYDDLFEEVKLLNSQFMALKSGSKWGLRTISGITLSKHDCDDIHHVGSYILFEIDSRFDIKTSDQLIRSADNRPVNYQYLFDDYELLENGAIWLHSAYGEVIFDQQLNELVPYQKQEISFLPFGYSIKADQGFTLLNDSFRPVNNQLYDDLSYNENYLHASFDSLSVLIRTNNYVEIGKFEKVGLYGNQFAIGYSGDTAVVFGTNASSITLPAESSLSLISASGSKEFLLFKYKDEVATIDENCIATDVTAFETFAVIDHFLIADHVGGKGVLLNNELVVSAKYKAIGRQKEGLTLLKRERFGLYAKQYDIVIDAEYDQRIKSYSPSVFVGIKRDEHIFINQEGKEIGKIKGAESVEYWKDSVALVKKGNEWRFFNIYSEDWHDLVIKSFTKLNMHDDELRIIALGEGGYGILSNKVDEVIPLSFNDIVQIGPPADPIYLTEKHISEADFSVVIYYNKDGMVIRKQAFEPDEYDLIYCDK